MLLKAQRKPGQKIVLLAFALAGAAMAFFTPGEGLAAHAASPPLRQQALSAALRPAFYQALAKDADSAYPINKKGCAALAKQKLKACFDQQGVHFSGAGSSLALALRLEAWGRAGDLEPVRTEKPAIAGNRVSYAYDNLIEWWRVLPIGFEQGFTIAKRPSGHGRLVLALAAGRSELARDSGAQRNREQARSYKGQVMPSPNRDQGGTLAWGKLHYGKLVVTDARGKVVPATLTGKGDRILIAVNDTRAVYPLMVDPLVWLTQKVSPSDGEPNGSFGISVAVSGNTAIIGAFGASVNGNLFQGAAYVFTESGGTWTQTQKLIASDGGVFNGFGYSVSLNGNTALIGAPFAKAVYVFTESNGIWTQTQKLTPSDGAASSGGFGTSIALDGATVLIGADGANIGGNSAQGAAYVFTESNGIWTQTQKLIASDGTAGDNFGASVALKGATVLIGAPLAGDGYVYFFTDSGGMWMQTQEFKGVEAGCPAASECYFGSSVALGDDTAFIGAPRVSVTGSNWPRGAVYVLTKSNGTWAQAQKLTPSDILPDQPALFGKSVALNGAMAVIGALEAGGDVAARGPGAAYLFTKSNGTWTQAQKFTEGAGRSKGLAGNTDSFGSAVALDGPTILIGASGATIDGNGSQGAAYFFGRSDLDLALSSPQLVVEGQQYISQTIATNNASVASPAVVATVTVPAAVNFVSATATQGSCSEASGIVTCNFGAINGNAGTATANVTFKVPNDIGNKTVENTASVANATPPLSAGVASITDFLPVASDGSLETHRNQAADGILGASDSDGNLLTFSIVTPPAHGTVTINDAHKGLYTYTPAAGYTSGDSFTFKANDGYADSNIATVIINVTNQPPVASGGTLSTDKNTTAEGALKASDPDGDSLSFSILTPPRYGSLKLDPATGHYTYTPAADYFGADSFTFRANDGQSDSNIATVKITVKGSAPPPPLPPKNDSSGGGGFGALFLVLLAALAAMTAWERNIGRRPIAFFRRAIGAASAAIKSRGRYAYPDLRRLPYASAQESRVSSLLHWLRSICRSGSCSRPRPRTFASLYGSGRQNQLETTRQKETNMWIHGKWTTAAVGLLALTVIVGAAFAPVSSAAPGHATVVTQHKPSGLTQQSIKVARKSGLPSHLVTMAPQSSLKLLSRATKLGPHALDSVIELTVALKLRNEAKLKSFLEQVQNPASAKYHQWLTPAEFTRLYGPTKADVAEVKAFLKARGITVKNVSSNRMLIHTEATTAVYEHAFRIRIYDYKLNGRSFYSTTDSPTISRAIAPMVVGILGLNHGVQLRPHHFMRPMGAADRGLAPRQAPPSSLTYLNPLQIAHAYNYPDITKPSNGAGVNVAILTADGSGLESLSDPHDFWTAFGLPDHTINVIPVDGDSGVTDGMGETLLDVEYSGAMGPGITQNVYVAANAQLATFTDMYNQFANDTNPDGTTKNQVMTTSWGAPESTGGDSDVADDQIFMQAASEGISMFAAAGDHGSGDGTSQDNVADYPSSSLYITAANGTQLNISDLAGDYGSEVVWNDANCFGNGPSATGGAISYIFEKPVWQQGPGVPTDIDMRMNSDMAATASCTHPMLTLLDGQWYYTGGTSAVAPQLAGMFADVVAENGGSVGQSNELIYSDVNAGNYASDFHDVTEGNNGAFQAGPDWDHPTGWGSPNVKNLISHIGIQGPKGTLAGTVTAAATGSAIAGAKVTAVASDGIAYEALTGNDGKYSRVLPAGDFTVTVSDYGYADGTATVSITDGNTTAKDFALHIAPQAILSGKVTDGSGHGYPLYADVKVSTAGSGQVADVWTNPKTGKYSVKLPKGAAYMLNVAAAFDGYNTASETLTLTGAKAQNFSLTVTATCMAPGYHFVGGGFGEGFNGGTFPPPGWTVMPTTGDVSWRLNSYFQQDNVTGGTGEAAEANQVNAYPDNSFSTSLVTSPIPVTSLPATPVLRYRAHFYKFPLALAYALDLDISTDSDKTWTTISHWTHSHSTSYGGVQVSQDLAPYLPASGDFQLRWRFYSPVTVSQFYPPEIDDVAIGRCGTIPGGLAYGRVTDSNTGDGLVGAAVADNVGDSTQTTENPADPAFPVGAYLLFTRAETTRLTASDRQYTPTTVPFTVTADQVKTHDFSLKAARLAADPGSFTLHAMVNNLTTATLVLKDAGSGNASFKVWAINAPPSGSAQASASPTLVAPISTFSAGIPIYGLTVDHNTSSLWLGSPVWPSAIFGDNKDHRFLFEGTNTGDTIDVSNPKAQFMTGMAFDANTGMIWQLGRDRPAFITSHIYELDPKTMMPTGNSILVPGAPSKNQGFGYDDFLAYDPLSNTWYAGGQYQTAIIFHFDSSGTLLDSSKNLIKVLTVLGLAYNAATGHLFVLGGDHHTIEVLDAKHGYALVRAFDIKGFVTSGAFRHGLGYDCNGDLWIINGNNVVWQVPSGESGWCVAKGTPWLTLAPEAGSVSAGASTTVTLNLDGTGQKEYTTSKVQLAVTGYTPYPVPRIPLTVVWDPQPVNLSLIGKVGPSSPRKGNTLLYTLTVLNQHANNHGTATQVKLTWPLPQGISYVAASGDGTCMAPPSTGSAPAAATGGSPANTVSCDFGTIALGASKTETLAVKAVAAGKLTSTFAVSAREPDSGANDNSLTLSSDVIGTANLSIGADKASIPAGGTGTLVLTLNNAGPDPAAEVQVHAPVPRAGVVSLQSVTASQGSCSVSGGVLACDLGQVDAGKPVTVTLNLFGTSEGNATMNVQASTMSDEPDIGNNSVSAKVTVMAPPSPKQDQDSGGGALGWLSLAALLGLVLVPALTGRRRA